MDAVRPKVRPEGRSIKGRNIRAELAEKWHLEEGPSVKAGNFQLEGMSEEGSPRRAIRQGQEHPDSQLNPRHFLNHFIFGRFPNTWASC
jgi:hypothetical protein